MAVDKVGQSITKGFYVPSSRSSSYVASKRNEEGSYEYTSQAQDIGLQRQAALQDLSEQYGDVVENAYASYLANQRTINASAMGQGYKDAYEKMQQEQLVGNLAQAGMSAANARQQLDESALKAREQLDEQFALETTNLDKVGTSLDNYFEYLKNLTNQAGQNYLEAMGIEYDENTKAQDIYNELYNSQAYILNEDKTPMFSDEEGNAGMSFLDYVNANLGDKQADTDWRDWLFYQGGWDSYLNALRKSDTKPYVVKEQEAIEKKGRELGLDNINIKRAYNNNNDGVDMNGKSYKITDDALKNSKEIYDYFSSLEHKLDMGSNGWAVVTVKGKDYIYKGGKLYRLEEVQKKKESPVQQYINGGIKKGQIY